MTPKLSVVMSVYNGEKYLTNSIKSILDQTYKNFEFIIIDDASTDRSLNIIGEYATADPRIRLVRNEENLGLTKSLNKGIRLTQGDFIARQDADDISAPDRLEKLVKYVNHNSESMLLASNVEVINDAGDFECHYNYSSYDLKKKLLRGNHFTHGSVCFSKKAFCEVGGYREAFRYAQDYDLFARMAEKYKIGYVNEYLYQWRNSREGISNTKVIEQLKYAVLIRCFILERLLNREDSYPKFAALGFDQFIKGYKYQDHYFYYFGRALFSLNQFAFSRSSLLRAKGFPQKYAFIILSYLGYSVNGVLKRIKQKLLNKNKWGCFDEDRN